MNKNLRLKYLLASCLNLLLVEECLAQQTHTCTVYSKPKCTGQSSVYPEPGPWQPMQNIGQCDEWAAAGENLSYTFDTTPCVSPPNNKQCLGYSQSGCTGTPISYGYPTLSQDACFSQWQNYSQVTGTPFLSYTWSNVPCVEVPQPTKKQSLNNKSHPQAQKK